MKTPGIDEHRDDRERGKGKGEAKAIGPEAPERVPEFSARNS